MVWFLPLSSPDLQPDQRAFVMYVLWLFCLFHCLKTGLKTGRKKRIDEIKTSAASWVLKL